MGQWGIYNSGEEFYANLNINDELYYERPNGCKIKGKIIKKNSPLINSFVLNVISLTKCMASCKCSLCSNKQIMILPNHCVNISSI